MNVNITFRHMEHTPALDNLIREKSEKFAKWMGPTTDVNWTCWTDGANQGSEVRIHSGHQEYFAKAQDDDLYKTVDQVVHKIQNQLK